MLAARPGFLRYRVINRFDAGNSELTNDLPHLNQSVWKVAALQPGQPASALTGSFSIVLPPPGSRLYKRYWGSLLSQLARYQRIEGYLGYRPRGIGLGTSNMKFAGFITDIDIGDDPSPHFVLSGVTDLGLWNMYRPFPGELTPNQVTTTAIKTYMASNELGASDTFNPFTAGNYVSTNTPAHTAGSWSSTTRDGVPVVANSSGTGAALLSKTGATTKDGYFTQYVQAEAWLQPSSDTVSAGQVGIGLSSGNADCTTSVVGYVEAFKTVSGRYNLNAKFAVYSAGTLVNSGTFGSVLTEVDDPSGLIHVELGLLVSQSGNQSNGIQATLSVAGNAVFGQQSITYSMSGTQYPFLFYGNPATGTATAYITNLTQFFRYSADSNPTNATVIPGNFATSTNSIGFGVDPGPSFLDAWTHFQNREGFWLNYKPQPFVIGTRTLGTLDFNVDPFVDRSAGSSAGQNVIYSKKRGNLLGLSLTDNADLYAAGAEVIAQGTRDGGGMSTWFDVATLQSIGVLQDSMLSVPPADYPTQRSTARRMMANKTTVGTAGSKTVRVLRDALTADVASVGDKITIDDPWKGITMLTSRILAREFTEGATSEVLTLDQFSRSGEELGFA